MTPSQTFLFAVVIHSGTAVFFLLAHGAQKRRKKPLLATLCALGIGLNAVLVCVNLCMAWVFR